MHSSRMRTGRSLTVCCSLLPGRGGGLPGPGGGVVCLVPGGGVCLVPGGSAWGGSCLPGPRGGVCRGRCLPDPGGGVCLVPGGGFSLTGGVLPGAPPVNRITHTCKNITLATTSLRPVIIGKSYSLFILFKIK